MSTFDPNDPFPQDRPRSSPIPGVSDTPTAGWGQPSATWTPGGQQPTPPPGFGVPAPGGAPMGWTPMTTRRRSGGWLFLIAFLLPVLMTGGIIAYVFWQVDDAVDQATDQFDQVIDSEEAEGLGLDVEATTLFEGPATAAVMATFDDYLAGEPTNFTMVAIYPDYAIATASDPVQPANLDQYIWRSGGFTGPIAQPNIDGFEDSLFSVADVDWAAIGDAASQAVALTEVPDGEVTHIVAQRFLGQDLSVSIYVSSARDSAYLELAPDGTVIAVH